MNILFLLLFNLITFDGPEVFTVMAVSGMNLRERPTLNSRVLKKLPFGTKVYSDVLYLDSEFVKRSENKDEINGVNGCWIKVQLKDGKTKGFLFSPYLFQRDIVDTNLDRVRILHEGYNCLNETDYHPDLNWFGLYKVNDEIIIRKVEIELKLSTIDSIDLPLEYKYDWYSSPHLSLETNVNEISLMLIGSKKKLIEGKFKIAYESESSGYSPSLSNGFLYPEQKITVYNSSGYHELRAEELIELDSATFEMNKSYELFYGVKQERRDRISETRLGSLYDFCCNAKTHASYQTPSIEMLVDLNNDNILDIILRQHTMTGGCGVCWTKSIFVSEYDSVKDSYKFKYLGSAMECSCL